LAPTLLYTGHGMGYQRTIRRQVSVEGIGLHSGEPVKLTLSPAAADTGILFRAADGTLIPADIEHVVDGRAKPFVDLLYSAGSVTLPVPRRPIAIREPVRVGDGNRWLEIAPSEIFRITYTLDNPHPVVGCQVVSLEVSESV